MMRKTMMAAVGAAAILLGVAGPAAATTDGAVNVSIVNTNTAAGFRGRAILTGAVTASCAEGPPVVTVGPAGTFHVEDTIRCPEGSLFVSGDGSGNFQLDPTSCIGRNPQVGTFQFTGGTGQFAGATGGGTFTADALVVFRRTANGCALDQAPVLVLLRVNLSGALAT